MDQARYGGGEVSPAGRKQWNKDQRQAPRPAEENRGPVQPEETGLPLNYDDQAKKKQQLQADRQREYNDMLAKGNVVNNKRGKQSPFHEGLPLGGYEQKRKELGKQLNAEMREAMEAKQRQHLLKQEYRREVAEGQRLAAGQQDQDLQRRELHKQQLSEERKREYQEYLAKSEKGRSRRADVLEGTGATLPVGEYDDNRKQQLQVERHREYLEQQQQKQMGVRDRGAGLPPKPATPNHFFKNIGEHDKLKEALNEERRKEYNQKMAQERGRSRGRAGSETDQYTGGLPLKQAGSAELRKMKTRNEEYNEFLQEKKWKDAHRFDSKKPSTAPDGQDPRHEIPTPPQRNQRGKPKDAYATLPGLQHSDSAEKRKIQERNQEYNDYLRQKNTKKGWATPTYDEILEQKRREEALRRQEEYKDPTTIRRYGSESAINKLEMDFRDRALDREIETRKVRFEEEKQRPVGPSGILEDDHWLEPEKREDEYKDLPEEHLARDNMAARVRHGPGYLASLPVGEYDRDSAKKRRQNDYRRELQLQMEESRAAKRRERVQDLRVNASGLLDPEKTSGRLQGLEGLPGNSPRRKFESNHVQPYHTKFLLDDSPSRKKTDQPERVGAYPGHDPNAGAPPRGILTNNDYGDLNTSGDDLRLDLGGGGGGSHRSRRDGGLGGDIGLVGMLNSRRPAGVANPPPGLMYQPSTYVTGGGGGAGGPYSSVDEAYHYYGMKNPLDIGDAGGGGGVVNAFPSRHSPPGRVTFAEDPPSTRIRDRSKERIDPYHFASDDDFRSKSRSEADNYGAELARQIEEKRRQKKREKDEQMRYEIKLEEDIKNYNPFGRGGGGAPIRDEGGNAVADLRSLQHGSYRSPRRQSPVDFSPRPPSPRDDKIKPPPAQQTAFGESTYARGGHGIFGQPKTDAEKDVTDKYKDELRQQIAEKRRREQQEKERERMEEEKEARRLEDQRVRMQEEYDQEQKKIKAREDEARKKNEEMKRLADEKKKEVERKRREADDNRMREQQDQMDRERADREQTNDGNKSPPLPAQRKGREPRDSPSAASVRSHRAQTQNNIQPSPVPNSNRPPSSDVLTQLASMRKQLQSERRRVENALENSKNEPDVFDPRTVQRPPAAGNKLIFENAVNKNASLPPPRAQTSDLANARNIQQFNELKFKGETDSRRQFRGMFPDAPITNRTLEDQQDAMLAQQEEQLRNLRDRNTYDPTPSNVGYGRRGGGNISARSQLASNSAFIDVENVNHFPEDFEDMAGVRNDSARARRRERVSPRPGSILNGMGSQASIGIDVDSIQRKNEDRLRRLQQMSTVGDDVSMGDPDDILERFMAKQRYNRPPSGQTLQDDTWLRPGSKPL